MSVWLTANKMLERLPFDKLHHNVMFVAVLPNIMHRHDVWVRQIRNRMGFFLKFL